MKLTDENGEEWRTICDYVYVENKQDLNARIIRKLEPPKAKPMPELKPGIIVRRKDLNSGQKPEVIIIQEVNGDGLFTGINISRGWNRECFCLPQVIEVCYPRTIDVIWSREP